MTNTKENKIVAEYYTPLKTRQPSNYLQPSNYNNLKIVTNLLLKTYLFVFNKRKFTIKIT
jgi:hypothetical protein